MFRNGSQPSRFPNGSDQGQPKPYNGDGHCAVGTREMNQPPHPVVKNQVGNAMETLRDEDERSESSNVPMMGNTLSQGTIWKNIPTVQNAQPDKLIETESADCQSGTLTLSPERQLPIQEKGNAQTTVDLVDLTASSSPKGKPFLESGRASEKKWKRRSC